MIIFVAHSSRHKRNSEKSQNEPKSAEKPKLSEFVFSCNSCPVFKHLLVHKIQRSERGRKHLSSTFEKEKYKALLRKVTKKHTKLLINFNRINPFPYIF